MDLFASGLYRPIFSALAAVMSVTALSASPFEVKSPDNNISLEVEVSSRVSFHVSIGGSFVMSADSIALYTQEYPAFNPSLARKQSSASVSRKLVPQVAYKSSCIEDVYNMLALDFSDGWSLEFRVYNDGLAYRFVTDFENGEVKVSDESSVLDFPDGSTVVAQNVGGYETPYEEPYTVMPVERMKEERLLAVLPLLVDSGDGHKILVSESSLADYPCMFVRGGDSGLSSEFPPVPLSGEKWGDRYVRITESADYIASTSGKRTYPWRYFVITESDGQLIENTMTARLAEPAVEDMSSWLEPGQVSWEFWNAASVYGDDVDFVSGFNTSTYKYFIDFASEFGIPYIIMDEGWAKDTRDPYTPSDAVDLDELIEYGNKKDVGIILWMTWLTVDKHPEVFDVLGKKGIKGLKIDFMNRSDQYMVNYYERVAAAAAKNKMVVSFHGAFKPSGLEYKYPNVLTYEGVRGMENMAGCQPANSVWLPFIRNAVGPMDYTPGAMISMQPESYCGNRPNAASVGTRAYQMALYIVFESGLQMLSDSPTLYYGNIDCTGFITGVPVTWDETVALACEAGKYAVIAKRKGDRWYIGAMNGTDSPLEVEVPMCFLAGKKKYRMESYEDGPNAFRQALDYRRKETVVSREDTVSVTMARNGGWAAVIE